MSLGLLPGFTSQNAFGSFPLAARVNAALKYAEFRASGPLWVLAVLLLGGAIFVMVVLTGQRWVQRSMEGCSHKVRATHRATSL